MALEAYIDDSGRGQGSVFVLAGLVSSAERWASFAEEWQAILDDPCEDGRRKLAYFKCFEAMGLQKQFDGWTEEERDSCLLRLVPIVERAVIRRLHISIPMKHFNAIVKNRISRDLDNPYLLAFWSVMSRWWFMTEEEVRDLREPIDFIFDEQQGRERREAERGYTLFRSKTPLEYRPLIGKAPIFRDDKQFLPLQAADLLAWHTRKVLDLKRRTGRDYDTETWRRLMAISAIAHDWSRSNMMEFVSGMQTMKQKTNVVFPYDFPPGHPKRRR